MILVEFNTNGNELYSQRKKADTRVIYSILNSLYFYTLTHFAVEEELMIRSSYPNYRDHKAEHDQFLKTIYDFKEDYYKNKDHLSENLLNFLKIWLQEHILKIDKEDLVIHLMQTY